MVTRCVLYTCLNAWFDLQDSRGPTSLQSMFCEKCHTAYHILFDFQYFPIF